MRAGRVAIAALTVGLAVACSKGAPGPDLVLDGRPHIPSDEGILSALSEHRLSLDSSRDYALSPKAVAFAALSLQKVPLGGRISQYVQVGLVGKTVVWVATFSAVIQLPGKPRVAFHIGTLKRIDEQHRAVFADGAVLRLDPAVVAPGPVPIRVRAEIDVASHSIRELVQLSD
jgi:hypothetical protein